MQKLSLLTPVVSVLLAAGACGGGGGAAPPDAGPDAFVPLFEVVGHSDLRGRGMNAAHAIVGDHVYVGSRTEGETHANAGVLIVDVSDPASPSVVGEIGPPHEGLFGMTSRELRAVPDKNLLIVLNFACSPVIHACSRDTTRFPDTGGVAETDNLKIYDVTQPTRPVVVATYDFGSHPAMNTTGPHEFFLWRDPADANRILLFFSMPLGPPAFQVLDISDLQNIQIVSTWDPQDDGGLDEPRGPNTLLHSVGVSAAGDLAYLSYESAGLLLLDTREIAAGVASPKLAFTHAVADRVDYSPPAHPGTHSAVEVPGRDLLVVTDEVYPRPLFPGCPWGSARLVDISDRSKPRVTAEIRVPEQEAPCPDPTAQARIAYTAHNATATANLALVTWHSGGLLAIDTTDPAAPVVTATFKPEPIGAASVEDPALGGNPVTLWSTPIIKDGLIYVVDIRNGLYILRYRGPHQEQIEQTPFLEGNSNLR